MKNVENHTNVNPLEGLPNLFLIDQEIQSEKNIEFAKESLKAQWNYSDDIIDKVAHQFECATEGNYFLNILDGTGDDMSEAWALYCDYKGIEEGEVDCLLID